MIGITVIYVGVMILGLMWIVFRVMSFLRSQKETEYRWNEAMYKDGFKAYPDELKKQLLQKNETDAPDIASSMSSDTDSSSTSCDDSGNHSDS